MTLYEIPIALKKALDKVKFDAETGEILVGWEAVEELDMELDSKLESYGRAYKNYKSDAEAIDAEIKRLQIRKRIAERAAASLSLSIDNAMQLSGKDKLSTPSVSLSYRKSEKVNADITKIPDEYKRYKAPEPDKTAIKNAIKSGIEVPGAELVQERNLQIK